MSSISGIGQGINPYLQSLSVTPPASQATTATASTATQGTTDDSGTSSQAVSGGHHHHHHGGGGGGGSLFSEIQSAVSTALQSAQTNGSASDPNKVVEDAIAQVIKNHQNGASGTQNQTSPSATDPDGDGDTAAASTGSTGSTNSTGSTDRSTFDQLLQSNGIDPQQFQKDFLSAVQTAQNGGSADASDVFSNFPPGSVVDTLA
jgi:hypothetical protein